MKCIWLFMSLLSIQSQAAEIQDARGQHSQAKEQLETLKKSVKIDFKKFELIEAELGRLDYESTKLIQEIKSEERELEVLSGTQQMTERSIQAVTAELQALLDQYRKELNALYVTGSTLRPDIQSDKILADYLPFLLNSRKQKAKEIESIAENLQIILENQSQNTKKVQKKLFDLTDKRDALAQHTADQRRLLASISRNLRTKRQRENALSADLQSLGRRIRILQLESGGAALSPLKGKMRWPVNGRVLRRFGQNRDDGFGDWHGLVISTSQNGEVKAVQSGKVAYAGYLLGYGLVVVIAHNDGYATIYGHNQSLRVETGQAVAISQIIAIAGNTGSLNSTALYFGVTRNGTPVNPGPWLN